MQIQTEVLNKIAEIIGTNDKNIVISVPIKALVDNGVDVSEAFDMLFGAGAYHDMAMRIYVELHK